MTPQLLRRTEAALAPRRPLFAYEELFVDVWAGRVSVARERCLARARAASRAAAGITYEYDFNRLGGWWEVLNGRPTPPTILRNKRMQEDRR